MTLYYFFIVSRHFSFERPDQWSVFRPLVVIGEQTFGHEIKMKGKLSASASLTLRIGPSTAEDSLIHQHQGHTVYESPQISISLSDLNFDAATYLGISKAKALSMREYTEDLK